MNRHNAICMIIPSFKLGKTEDHGPENPRHPVLKDTYPSASTEN